jgi:hypothetical protein
MMKVGMEQPPDMKDITVPPMHVDLNQSSFAGAITLDCKAPERNGINLEALLLC